MKAAIVVGLLVTFVIVGTPAQLVREIRQARDPVGLILAVLVISFIIGSFVVMMVVG